MSANVCALPQTITEKSEAVWKTEPDVKRLVERGATTAFLFPV